MHRSRISTLLIDAHRDDAHAAAAFWTAAIGGDVPRETDEEQFLPVPDAVPGLVTAVQAVDDQPRYHLDMETDDLDAETARLVGLGAVEVARWLDCRTLRVPGGHLVCVIPVHSDPDEFAAHARVRP